MKLLEVVVAVAVVAVGVGALILSIGTFGRFSAAQAGPVHSAAMLLAEQTLRVAQDAWKYGSPGSAPSGSWQTTVPLNIPGASPTSAPVTVAAAISSVTAQGAQLTVTVTYTPDPHHAGDSGVVSVSGATHVLAPMPGATVLDPGLIAQPSGAP